MFKLAVLASGRGSNFASIVEKIEAGELPGVVADVLVSDNPQARALEIAREHGIEGAVFRREDYPTNKAHNQAMADFLKARGIDLIVLAGYMRIVRAPLLEAFPNRIINIHPALLPSFPGLDGQKQALEWGVRYSGCSVHFVDADVDHGPIILQAVVPVEQDDTVETLSARILKEEHNLLPRAIGLIAAGKVVIEGRRVRIVSNAER
ncbi:phosphoribosylglycinamide formyltransferase [Candidatus Sumerlaeota bacterium]|nr:phosphoribosylglycinamide formyltransferase [Candidatus Sumerlaeota bacterium]